MTLALKLYQKGEGGATLMRERSFETPRITLGRGADCELTLEDPKKWVSRIHAVLNVEGSEYWLNVVSKVNPVFVAGQRHDPGSRVQLHGGDKVEIGEYVIELVPPAPPPPPPEPAEPTFVREPVPQPSEATFIGQPVPEEPDILLEADPVPAPQPAAVTQPMPAPPAPKAPAVDDSVFAEATYTGAAPPAGVFDEPTYIGKSMDGTKEQAAPVEESVEDSVFKEVTLLRNLPPPEDGLFDEPSKGGGDSPTPAPVPAPAEPEVPYEDRSVFLEQTLLRARSAETTFPQPEEEGSAGQAAGPGAQDALKVFFEGVGLPPRSFSGDAEAEQYLRQCGAITRAAIDGVMALLVARAEAKKEFRAEDRTMVASRDNNPLKLMADPQEAVDFLFDPKERSGGFLTPVQAVSDAFDDMRAHEAALIAGMRAAILGAVARFDPKTLEEELEKSSGGLGLNRKARLWELFAAYQQKLARDANDDFNKVFGRDFLSAYMAQVKQLKKK
jgi:type VI secretion system FHA domain protein